jgi:hypothetical protein
MKIQQQVDVRGAFSPRFMVRYLPKKYMQFKQEIEKQRVRSP